MAHPSRKLTAVQVAKVRSGRYTIRALAYEFQMSEIVLKRIRDGVTYRDLPMWSEAA